MFPEFSVQFYRLAHTYFDVVELHGLVADVLEFDAVRTRFDIVQDKLTVEICEGLVEGSHDCYRCAGQRLAGGFVQYGSRNPTCSLGEYRRTPKEECICEELRIPH